jgi:hypothetical protein
MSKLVFEHVITSSLGSIRYPNLSTEVTWKISMKSCQNTEFTESTEVTWNIYEIMSKLIFKISFWTCYYIFSRINSVPEFTSAFTKCATRNTAAVQRRKGGHAALLRQPFQLSPKLLEWRSGIRPGPLYPRAGAPSSLGPPEPTTTRL